MTKSRTTRTDPRKISVPGKSQFRDIEIREEAKRAALREQLTPTPYEEAEALQCLSTLFQFTDNAARIEQILSSTTQSSFTSTHKPPRRCHYRIRHTEAKNGACGLAVKANAEFCEFHQNPDLFSNTAFTPERIYDAQGPRQLVAARLNALKTSP